MKDSAFMPRHLELLLTAAATALAVAFLAIAPTLTREQRDNPLPGLVRTATLALTPSEKAPLLGPSVLAGIGPAPDLNLDLPSDYARVVRRSGINGETGLIPTAASITTFRLRASGDLVSVAAPTGVDAIRRINGDADPGLRVHGAYAISSIDRNGSTVVRWTENGVTYEISSRTLDAARLIEVADRLR